jgi:type I restriction enzyme S subunit
MREGWVEVALIDVAEVTMGRQLSPEKVLGIRPKPYLRAANITGKGIDLSDVLEMDFSETEEAKFASKLGDVLLVEGGNEKSVGTPALVDDRHLGLCIHNTVIRCRTIDQATLDPAFLYQSLRARFMSGEFGELCTGTTIKHLGQKRVAALSFVLPPLAEQRRIVDVIESVDNYITALETRAETARTARSALLHDLLSNPGPHWTDTTLGDAAHITNGGTPSTENLAFWGGTTPWITTTELSEFDGKEISSSRRTLTPLGLENGPARLIRVGSTLLGTTATIGTSAIASAEISFNQQITGLTPKDASLLDRYLFNWTQNSQEIFQSLAAGTSFKRISTSNLRSVQISVPPLAEQRRIVDVIESVDRDSKELDSCLHEAQTVRSALLSDLLSGNHEIPASYDQFLGAA